jgi:hypothetical protein
MVAGASIAAPRPGGNFMRALYFWRIHANGMSRAL